MDKSVHEKSPKSVHEKLPFYNVHEKLPISKKSVHEMSPSHPYFVSFLSSTTELSVLVQGNGDNNARTALWELLF